MTNRLVALDLPGGPGFVDALRRVWDDGDAALPLDPRLPPPARASLVAAMAPGRILGHDGATDLPTGRAVEPGDALVVPTSGSTGDSKGVVLTHSALDASARATNARLGVRHGDHWLACLPLAHIGGLSVVVRAIRSGTALTVHSGFDAAAVMASGATLVSLVATALARIDPATFRVILLGGAAPPPAVPSNVVTTYGMTETGSGVVYDGAPLDGVELRIAPDGEILLRGPMLLRAYRDGTDPFRDGWFPTGDVGRWIESGRLHVDGRRGDLIVTGGENVWPEPVERVLRGLPSIADVAVTGIADPEWGEAVTAYVVPAGRPPSLDDLRGAVKAELPAYCAPRRLILVDEIPRTSIGKVARSYLNRTPAPPSMT